MGLLYDIAQAVRTAEPYTVSVLGYANQFIYRDGVLCFVRDRRVHILPVHERSEIEYVVNPDIYDVPNSEITLLHYSHGILTFLFDTEDSRHLEVVETNAPIGRYKPLYYSVTSSPTDQVFVRNDTQYLIYGCREGGQWMLQQINLVLGYPTTTHVMDREFQEDLGRTFCCEIIGPYLYLVSIVSRAAREARLEEVDDFYACARIDLDSCEKVHGKMWRRKHKEGSINDIYTRLSLQPGRNAGSQPQVVESRREHLNYAGQSVRTCYIQQLLFSEDGLNPPGELFRESHSESEIADRTPAVRDFKCSFYHCDASAFIDITKDAKHPNGIRLRTSSRRSISPVDKISGLLSIPGRNKTGSGRDKNFEYDVRLWPADDAPGELFNLLCPSGNKRVTRIVADDRCVIYSVPSETIGAELMIFINFDPSIAYPGRIISTNDTAADSQKALPLGIKVQWANYHSYNRTWRR
jgi:hypothetical protein